jgi:hypothetical protein
MVLGERGAWTEPDKPLACVANKVLSEHIFRHRQGSAESRGAGFADQATHAGQGFERTRTTPRTLGSRRRGCGR